MLSRSFSLFCFVGGWVWEVFGGGGGGGGWGVGWGRGESANKIVLRLSVVTPS